MIKNYFELKHMINNNINNNKKIYKEYLELKVGLPPQDEDYTESDYLKSIKLQYELLDMMFKNIVYNDEWDGINNAILCSVEVFLDYLDEFVYLYESKRFTLLNQCLRGAFEAFLALNTLLVHPCGLDILKNNSDNQERKIQLHAAKHYNVGTEKDAKKAYENRLKNRQSKETMNILDQVLLFEGNSEYASHDLYALYRFLSGDSHFNLTNEVKKRLVQVGENIKIKTQSKSSSGLTMTLHMDVLAGHMLIIIFKYIFSFDI